MNPKYHLDDKVCLFYSARIIEQIRRSIYKKELVDIQKLFEEIETYFIIEITIKKDNVTYLINETNCRDYLTNFSVDENEILSVMALNRTEVLENATSSQQKSIKMLSQLESINVLAEKYA